MQSDLISFNGYPILTMEDDNSKVGQATPDYETRRTIY